MIHINMDFIGHIGYIHIIGGMVMVGVEVVMVIMAIL
jgi:hypothetical protein